MIETPPLIRAVCDPCQASRHASCLATIDVCDCVCQWSAAERAEVVIVSVEVS